MMGRTVSTLASFVLAACGTRQPQPTAFEREAARYEFIKKHGASVEDRCAEAQRVKDAASAEQRPDDYDLWKMTAEADCLDASMKL
jgi:hypothetical protein